MTSIDADSFERLVRPHMPALFRAAYRWAGNTEDAKDLVQEVCIAACGHLEQLEVEPGPRPWLLRVLYNRFVDGVRQRKRAPVVASGTTADCSELSSESASEELGDDVDRERSFMRAWIELEDTQRALLALRAEGYGLAEMSAITGIAQDALGPRLHRARLSLKRHLDRLNNEGCATARLGSAR
jgi:RNA polymerase sigma-70 factor (ECF subfamily)